MKKTVLRLRRRVGVYGMIGFSVFLLGMAILSAARLSATFADFYVRRIGSALSAALAFCSSAFPCSLAECLLLCVPVFLFAFITAAVYLTRRGRLCVTRLLCGILATLLLLLGMFGLTYGAGYRGSTLFEKLGLQRQDVTAQQLRDTALWLAEKTNEAAREVSFGLDAFSEMPYDFSAMSEKVLAAYSAAAEQYAFLPRFSSRAKPVLLSEPWTYTHTAGIYTFFTGEANININLPEYTQPFTTAHEFAHQRGIAPENEANLMAFLVLAQSEDPYLRYCAYLGAFEYFRSPLYRTDTALYTEVMQALCPQARGEMRAYSAFFEKYSENVAANVSGALNNAYLQSQGQSAGSRSYGLVVDLLVAYYEKTVAAGE